MSAPTLNFPIVTRALQAQGTPVSTQPGVHRLTLPIPALKDGGEPFDLQAQAKSQGLQVDGWTNCKKGNGVHFINNYDGKLQGANGDGKSILIADRVSVPGSEDGRELTAAVAKSIINRYASLPTTSQGFYSRLAAMRADLPGELNAYTSDIPYMHKNTPQVSLQQLAKKTKDGECFTAPDGSTYIKHNGIVYGFAPKVTEGHLLIVQGAGAFVDAMGQPSEGVTAEGVAFILFPNLTNEGHADVNLSQLQPAKDTYQLADGTPLGEDITNQVFTISAEDLLRDFK